MDTSYGRKTTGTGELNMQETGVQNNQPPNSEKQLAKQPEQVTSQSLPFSVSTQLVALMKQVVEKEVTPTTVRAACECARTVNELLKTNLEMIKRGL